MNKGFTLVELVVVIVILGILAAVAAPKYINLQGDAQTALIKNIQGNLKTAVTFVDLKKQIQGKDATSIDYNGNTITLITGYPKPDASQMRFLLDMGLPSTTFTANWATKPCKDSEYCIVGNRPSSDGSLPNIPAFTSGTGVFFWPEGYTLKDCFAYYLNLADGSVPIVASDTSGC